MHIHLHNHTDHDTKQSLKLIHHKLDIIMANEEQFKAALSRIDEATSKGAAAATQIQERITSLEDTIKNSGLDKETEEKLLAQTEGLAGNAEALSTALTSMGKSETDPVPNDFPEALKQPGEENKTESLEADTSKDITMGNVKKAGPTSSVSAGEVSAPKGKK